MVTDSKMFCKSTAVNNFLRDRMNNDLAAKQYHKYYDETADTYDRNRLSTYYGAYIVFTGPPDELIKLFHFSNRLKMNCIFSVLKYIIKNKLFITVYIGLSGADHRLILEKIPEKSRCVYDRIKKSARLRREKHPLGEHNVWNIAFFFVEGLNYYQSQIVEAALANYILICFREISINPLYEVGGLQNFYGTKTFLEIINDCIIERMTAGLIEAFVSGTGLPHNLLDDVIASKMEKDSYVTLVESSPLLNKMSSDSGKCADEIIKVMESELDFGDQFNNLIDKKYHLVTILNAMRSIYQKTKIDVTFTREHSKSIFINCYKDSFYMIRLRLLFNKIRIAYQPSNTFPFYCTNREPDGIYDAIKNILNHTITHSDKDIQWIDMYGVTFSTLHVAMRFKFNIECAFNQDDTTYQLYYQQRLLNGRMRTYDNRKYLCSMTCAETNNCFCTISYLENEITNIKVDNGGKQSIHFMAELKRFPREYNSILNSKSHNK